MGTDFFLAGLLQGLILAFVAYAVMIPFRILQFSDLTAEGAYPLGGAICASVLLMGLPVVIAILLSSLGAGMMGVCTSLTCLRLKVNSLLSGVILSTMAYSINLRIMGKPNLALFDIVFQASSVHHISLVLIILLVSILLLAIFLHTELGLRLRAVGLNLDFSKKQGINIEKYMTFGLFVAGCFTGLAGSLMVLLQSYMDVGMGVGIVIHALAALMIGEKIVGNDTLSKQLIAPLVGALLYQQLQGVALICGLAPCDLKFFTGSLILIVIAIQRKNKCV